MADDEEILFDQSWFRHRGNTTMKLTVLMDNNTYIDQYFLGEPAFSVYIEEGAEKILFDTG